MILKWILNTKYLKWNLEVDWQLFMWHVLICRFGFGIYISDFSTSYPADAEWNQTFSFGWGINMESGMPYPHLISKTIQRITWEEIYNDDLLRRGMSGLI